MEEFLIKLNVEVLGLYTENGEKIVANFSKEYYNINIKKQRIDKKWKTIDY